MPNYPFQRAKPLGWAFAEALTSAQANQIDANAAQAADGLAWTDVAGFRNWSPVATVTAAGSAACYVSTLDAWFLLGVSGGVLTSAVMFGGGGAPGAGISSPVGGVSSVEARAVAHDPVNNQLVVGTTPTASSNQKYRRAPMTAAASFSAGTSSQTNTTGVGCIEYSQALGMLVAGHLGTGVVETSVDGGLTWTNRTVPNTNPRVSMAAGPGGVVVSSSASTNKLIHSANGINWFERTLPSTRVWSNVVYVPLRGEYVAIADGINEVAVSTDGVTWTTRSFTLGAALNPSTSADQKFTASGRNIFGVVRSAFGGSFFNLYVYSQDGGITWRVGGVSTLNATIGTIKSSGNQLLYMLGTGVQWSLATGF